MEARRSGAVQFALPTWVRTARSPRLVCSGIFVACSTVPCLPNSTSALSLPAPRCRSRCWRLPHQPAIAPLPSASPPGMLYSHGLSCRRAVLDGGFGRALRDMGRGATEPFLARNTPHARCRHVASGLQPGRHAAAAHSHARAEGGGRVGPKTRARPSGSMVHSRTRRTGPRRLTVGPPDCPRLQDGPILAALEQYVADGGCFTFPEYTLLAQTPKRAASAAGLLKMAQLLACLLPLFPRGEALQSQLQRVLGEFMEQRPAYKARATMATKDMGRCPWAVGRARRQAGSSTRAGLRHLAAGGSVAGASSRWPLRVTRLRAQAPGRRVRVRPSAAQEAAAALALTLRTAMAHLRRMRNETRFRQCALALTAQDAPRVGGVAGRDERGIGRDGATAAAVGAGRRGVGQGAGLSENRADVGHRGAPAGQGRQRARLQGECHSHSSVHIRGPVIPWHRPAASAPPLSGRPTPIPPRPPFGSSAWRRGPGGREPPRPPAGLAPLGEYRAPPLPTHPASNSTASPPGT